MAHVRTYVRTRVRLCVCTCVLACAFGGQLEPKGAACARGRKEMERPHARRRVESERHLCEGPRAHATRARARAAGGGHMKAARARARPRGRTRATVGRREDLFPAARADPEHLADSHRGAVAPTCSRRLDCIPQRILPRGKKIRTYVIRTSVRTCDASYCDPFPDCIPRLLPPCIPPAIPRRQALGTTGPRAATPLEEEAARDCTGRRATSRVRAAWRAR